MSQEPKVSVTAEPTIFGEDGGSVKLDREAAGIVPFEFSSEAISTPENTANNNEISGTPGDDNLVGTNVAEVINGGTGDDNIFGNDGMDTLIGGTGDDDIYGSSDAEVINGGTGDDNISGNGGMDTLIGGTGDDNIYGSSDAEVINGGTGDDIIYANGGSDLIDSGFGFDTVNLGAGEATVILGKGEGFDTIFNFQLGATTLKVGSLDNLNFADSVNGAEIFHKNDLLAVVAGQSANTFSSNQDMIFSI